MNQSAKVEESGLEAQYLATQTGVAVLDFSRAGKLELSGKNATQFLHGLVTNDVKSLAPGRGAAAAFLNLQGKVLALSRIYSRESSLLLEIEGSNREKVFRSLSRFVAAGEFFVTDISEKMALVSLQGPKSEELISTLVSQPPGTDSFSHTESEIASTKVLVTRHSRAGTSGFDLFVPVEDVAAVRRQVFAAGLAYGAVPVSDEAFEIARIDAGIPREPRDVNENNILLEAGFEDAVSYTKGCYLGQEIIARIHWRGQPAKRLKRLRVEGAEVPPAGAELFAEDGKRVGEITSSAAVPAGGSSRVAALGYVHRYYLAVGTRFTLKVDGSVVGEAELLS